MTEITYSVIVPVYNGERTLARCLNSLLLPDRADVQIIVISDGSTDGSDEIAGAFAGRIEFYRQSHSGVSAARNLGLRHARGKYILFVDCDDYVLPDFFSRLDGEADCGLLVFGLPRSEKKRLDALSREGKLRRLLDSRRIMPPFHKRFRRSLIREMGLRFEPGLQVGEDFCFCYLYALRADTIAVSDACTYIEDRSDSNSLSRRYRPRLGEDLCRVFAVVTQPAQHLDILDRLFARSALSAVAEVFKDRDLHPLRDRARLGAILDPFRPPLGPCRGFFHRTLRFLLRVRGDTLLYCIAYFGKGRKFRKCRKKF